jgi:predicted nucleic acid-binding protein
MRLVVDTNILFSFFRENPVRFIIANSNSFGLELFSPEYGIEELTENKSELMKYSGMKTNEELILF